MEKFKILVPINYDPLSETAIEYAAFWAKHLQAEVVLFHGVELPIESDLFHPKISQEIANDQTDKLRTYAAKMSELHQIEFLFAIANGEPQEAIYEFTQKINVDLIVMATKGNSSFLRGVFKSNAVKVKDTLNIPLLIIPHDFKIKPVLKMAYATDFVHMEEEIGEVADLACVLGASLEVVHVFNGKSAIADKSQPDVLSEIKRNTTYQNIYYHQIEAPTVESGIKTFVKEHEIDVLAMFNHSRNSFWEKFNPSLTDEFALVIQNPLLLFKN